jgi:serine/threonine protein kinase
VQKILHEKPVRVSEYRSDVSEGLADIVDKALAKDCNERYRVGLDIASDLSKAFDALLEAPQENITEQEQFLAVKQLDFFQGFPDVEIWEIVRAGNWQDYADGEEIIVEGDLDDSFYIIVNGEVSVQKIGKELRVLFAGDCFGEMGYLAKTKRTATIVARGATSLLKVNSTVISQVSLNCQVRFLKVFLRTLIHRLSVTTEMMSQDI